MAISKKSSSDKQSLKLAALENNLYNSLTALTAHIVKQENRLSKTLDSLKAKLKKAIAKQKLVKKTKKNLTPAHEKQRMKAQVAVDSLELDIALTTDNLSLTTAKADQFTQLAEIIEVKSAKKAKTKKTAKKASKAPKAASAKAKTKTKTAKIKTRKTAKKATTQEASEVVIVTKADKASKKAAKKIKAAKPAKSAKATKAPRKSKRAKSEVEQFDFEELFTPEMGTMIEKAAAHQQPDSSAQA